MEAMRCRREECNGVNFNSSEILMLMMMMTGRRGIILEVRARVTNLGVMCHPLTSFIKGGFVTLFFISLQLISRH
jgi:hypothetical protein